MTVIPFFSTTKDWQRSQWLETLQGQLPEFRVLHADDCSDAEKLAARVAIVASPDPASITEFPDLEWIQSLWAGVEALLVIPGLEKIPVVRMIDPMLADTMAEAVLAWALYLHREMPAYRAQQSERRWRALPAIQSENRRIGLLGYGELGQKSAEKLAENHFRISAWSRTPKTVAIANHYHGKDGLQTILGESDILVCLLPLTNDTFHLLDNESLASMKVGAQLINFGRGGLIDTSALLHQLDKHHLNHAVLDVFETEPLPADSPLWTHPGVTVLPHISAPTNTETASKIAAANVRTWFETGRIPKAVERHTGY